MASSMLLAAAEKISPAAEEEIKDEGCRSEDAHSSTMRSCVNDPDFAIICSFLQKFSKDLDLEIPNFKLLQEGLSNTDEVSPQIRDLHMKLLRKTRKTVHEKTWELTLSKFCWFHSAQDAWEIERFGYKKSSLKVKLRILRELLETQIERNGKFRSKVLRYGANELRAEPIGRDRLGHSYWLTQDNDCNLRIYQEHLDEDIFQVVATNREEFVKLISRLRGNEVVLPSNDIGIIDEDTSSSGNSGAVPLEKPPPPEEQDDSQEDEVARVPNIRIKLSSGGACDAGKGEEELAAEEDAKLEKQREMGNATEEEFDEESDSEEFDEEEESEAESEDDVDIETAEKLKQSNVEEAPKKVKPLLITQAKLATNSPTHYSTNSSKKRTVESVDKSSPTREELNAPKKARPTLLDSKREKKPSRYEKSAHDDDESEEDEAEEEEDESEDDIDTESMESDVDSAAADEGENETKDQLDTEDDDDVGDEIEDPAVFVRGEGTGNDCDGENDLRCLSNLFDDDEIADDAEVIEDEVLYVIGEGEGAACLVGNAKTEIDAASTTSAKASTVPQATFFFGVPGCLNLSPMKKTLQEELESVSSRAQEKQENNEMTTQTISEKIEKIDTQCLLNEGTENQNCEELSGTIREIKEEQNVTCKDQAKMEEKLELAENKNITVEKAEKEPTKENKLSDTEMDEDDKTIKADENEIAKELDNANELIQPQTESGNEIDNIESPKEATKEVSNKIEEINSAREICHDDIEETNNAKELDDKIDKINSLQEGTSEIEKMNFTNEGTFEIEKMNVPKETTNETKRMSSPKEICNETPNINPQEEIDNKSEKVSLPEENTNEIKKIDTSEENSINKEEIISPKQIATETKRINSPEEARIQTHSINPQKEVDNKLEPINVPKEKTIEIKNINSPKENAIEIQKIISPNEIATASKCITTPKEDCIQKHNVNLQKEVGKNIEEIDLPKEETIEVKNISSLEDNAREIGKTVFQKEIATEIQRISSPTEDCIEMHKINPQKEVVNEIEQINLPKENTMEIKNINSPKENSMEIKNINSPKENAIQIEKITSPKEIATESKRINSPENSLLTDTGNKIEQINLPKAKTIAIKDISAPEENASETEKIISRNEIAIETKQNTSPIEDSTKIKETNSSKEDVNTKEMIKSPKDAASEVGKINYHKEVPSEIEKIDNPKIVVCEVENKTTLTEVNIEKEKINVSKHSDRKKLESLKKETDQITLCKETDELKDVNFPPIDINNQIENQPNITSAKGISKAANSLSNINSSIITTEHENEMNSNIHSPPVCSSAVKTTMSEILHQKISVEPICQEEDLTALTIRILPESLTSDKQESNSETNNVVKVKESEKFEKIISTQSTIALNAETEIKPPQREVSQNESLNEEIVNEIKVLPIRNSPQRSETVVNEHLKPQSDINISQNSKENPTPANKEKISLEMSTIELNTSNPATAEESDAVEKESEFQNEEKEKNEISANEIKKPTEEQLTEVNIAKVHTATVNTTEVIAVAKLLKQATESVIAPDNSSSKHGEKVDEVLERLAPAPAYIADAADKVKTSISPAFLVPNRKRRLAELAAVAGSSSLESNRRQSTSESEPELNIDYQEELLEKQEDLVGGKRLKMRPKLTNLEVRKKVEAQKIATEEITSSSGSEEDACRRRKIISPPKRLYDKVVTESPIKRTDDVKPEHVTERPEKKTKNLIKPADVITETIEKDCNLLTNAKPITTTTTVAASTVIRQKPTLAEIIEKKLKKTPLPSVTVVTTTPTFSAPKKSPVTKPLKKNLLTQIRQQESDEEAIPRKRTISEKPTTPVTPVEKIEVLTSAPKFEEKLEEIKHEEPNVTTGQQLKMFDRKTPERQRKRRSSEEFQQPTPDKCDDPKDGVCEKVKKNNEHEKELAKATTMEEKLDQTLVETPIDIADIKPNTNSISEISASSTSKITPCLSNAVDVKTSSLPTKPVTEMLTTIATPVSPVAEKAITISCKTIDEDTPKEKDKQVDIETSKVISHISLPTSKPASDKKSSSTTKLFDKEILKTNSNPIIPTSKPANEKPSSPSTKLVDKETSKTNTISDVSISKPATQKTSLHPAAEITKITLPSDILAIESTNQTPTIGRRSGRRGGAAVVHAELPQPKRTRGGGAVSGAAVAAKVNLKKDEVKNVTVRSKIEKEVLKIDKETAKVELEPVKLKIELEDKKSAEHVQDQPVSVETIKIESKIESLAVKPKDELISPPSNVQPLKSTVQTPAVPSTTPSSGRGRGMRKKRDVDTTNIIDTADAETPVRQSRRIAQQKIREEAERRKLEEIALRTMKQELKKKKKAEKQSDPTVAEPSEHSSSASSEESEVETKKKAKKKLPGKDGWSSGSEEKDAPEEDEEPPHYETDPGSPLFKSDHEFSPESDLEDASQIVPMKRARTVRKEDAEDNESGGDEEACQKCGKSDHPEWILLCDKCDRGYHCSCLSPVLFYIPEGDWFCPPCQQEQLIKALERHLKKFDGLLECKRLKEVEEQRLNAEAKRVEEERIEEEKLRKEQKKEKKEKQRNGKEIDGTSTSSSNSESSDNTEDREKKKKKKNKNKRHSAESGDDAEQLSKKSASSKRVKKDDDSEDDDDNEDTNKSKRRCRNGRRRRRAATRGARNRQRGQRESDGSNSGSDSDSGTDSDDSSLATATDSDNEPIYKLRKRRQINVSYRLNEYDDLINSALKKEMDSAGNLGRGKDISTIIEADKEEQARIQNLQDDEVEEEIPNAGNDVEEDVENKKPETKTSDLTEKSEKVSDDEDKDETLKRKAKPKLTLKKKSRKLTTLDVSSEEDRGSDEDFKTSSFGEDEDEDTTNSLSSNSSDSSLEIYRRRNKGGKKKKQRKAARKAARERRKDRKFVVDESDDDDEALIRPKTKKKRKEDSDYTESETCDDQSELSENMDSADLCDDTTSDDSEGAWHPSKRKKQRKSNAVVARKSPKLKKPQVKKVKRVEYSDDDISESEEEEEDEEDDGIGGSGKGSGKQPRSQPLKTNSNTGKGKGKGGGSSRDSKSSGKGKGKGKTGASKKKKKRQSDDEDSFSDSDDSTRGRTRGRRYAYLDDYEDDSSDGGIKPGVKRPDTPPEEREKFIQKQEEIKRMLAAKNAEGAKLAATPRLTPIKGAVAGDKRTPTKTGSDSLSTVPLSVIRQAKVLDIDYLQRKGESIAGDENVDDVDSEFDDADLPDDFPEDMDEDAIARMVEEEEEFGASAAAARELSATDDAARLPASLMTTPNKIKTKDAEKIPLSTNPSLAALSQMPGASPSGLQEPLRKRLPMPTMHPPLLRHQFQPHPHQHHTGNMPPAHMLQRHHHAGPPTHLLQNALLGQPLNRNFPHHPRMQGMHLMPARQSLLASHPLGGHAANEAGGGDSEAKPRGRRKKITPLRDPLQKQQAAAAATAAAVHAAISSDKPENVVPTSGVVASVIKTATSASVVTATPPTTTLSIAQPPQLYKPTGSGSGQEAQPSVITRMPHLPPGRPGCGPSSAIYNEVARFYGGPPNMRQPQPGQQRHRSALQMPCMPPHPSMRPTYGPPPPLRGAGTPPNHGNHQTPPTVSPSSALRGAPPYLPNTQGEQAHHLVGYGPPPARHAASHLNPYRPPIYGNPNFAPRGPPQGANRPPPGALPSAEYAGGPRGYPPFGYYPAPLPPPLNAAHQPTLTHASVPSSVIVATPSAQQQQPSTVNQNVPTVTQRTGSAKALSPAPVISVKGNTMSRKKLLTLEAYSTSVKSPLAIGGESSGSRSSPGAEDSTSATAAVITATASTAAGGVSNQIEEEEEGQASEFSGLVSYFSSQHDDYNS